MGDYNAAVANLGKAMTNLLVTGFDTSDVTIGTMGTTISVTAKPKLLGPLGDLFTIMTIPAQEAQYFTNLMPPPSCETCRRTSPTCSRRSPT